MAIGARQRWTLYAIALVLTLITLGWAGGQDSGGTAEAATRPERPAREAAARDLGPSSEKSDPSGVPDVQLVRLARVAPEKPGNLFESTSWLRIAQEEARNSAPPPPPPPKPTAPPLPFAYMGKLVEGDVLTVFATKQDRNYILRPGDIVEGTYRVDEITPTAVVLTFLPLNERQTLPIGAD